MEKKEQGTVQALERGLKILELLMQEKRPMGVNEIAKCQGITPSAAYRILKTLEATGWSFQMSDDKYIPGEKLSYVTEKNNFHLALAEVAVSGHAGADGTGNSADEPGRPADRRFFILQQTRTNRYVDFVAPVGSALPLHASAGGKILLCELPEVLRAQFLDGISFESMTPNTICTKRSFWRSWTRSGSRAMRSIILNRCRTPAVWPCRSEARRGRSTRRCRFPASRT